MRVYRTKPSGRPRLDAVAVFNSRHVKHESGCWLWTGTRKPTGYGRMSANGQGTSAHRFSYEHHVGPIPDGLEIDHLCNEPACVNPDHLEPVTRAENLRRKTERHTHCRNGHEFTASNTYVASGRRYCRECGRVRTRAWYERTKEKSNG